jgi:hypothetical protein
MVSIIMRQWILFTLSPSFLSVSSSMRQHGHDGEDQDLQTTASFHRMMEEGNLAC